MDKGRGKDFENFILSTQVGTFGAAEASRRLVLAKTCVGDVVFDLCEDGDAVATTDSLDQSRQQFLGDSCKFNLTVSSMSGKFITLFSRPESFSKVQMNPRGRIFCHCHVLKIQQRGEE